MSNGIGVPSPPQSPTQLPSPLTGTNVPVPNDRHIRRGQEEYAWALSALLPQGIAWPRWPDSTLMKTVYGLAGIMGWTDNRAADLLERESDPRIATEMLDSWERAWGLPDPCFRRVIEQPDGTIIELPPTIGERRTILMTKYTLLGGQSRQFFEQIVGAFLGYDMTIEEYRPFMAGIDRCGDARAYDPVAGSLGPFPCQIGSFNMRFAWTVHVLSPKLVWFKAAAGMCGIDHLLEIEKFADAECIIRRWAPAHTVVLFDYSKIGDPWAGTKKDFVQLRTGELVVQRNAQQVVCVRILTNYALIVKPFWLGSPSFAWATMQTSRTPPLANNYSLGSPVFAFPKLTVH